MSIDMSHRGTDVVRAVIVLAVMASAVGACTRGESSAKATTTTTAPAPAPLQPPVISKALAGPPCDEDTTTGRLGCAMQQAADLDRRIDEVVAELFGRLSPEARRRFVDGEAAWLRYRDSFCASQSDVFEGGSEAAPHQARCTAKVNAEHLAHLTEFRDAVAGR